MFFKRFRKKSHPPVVSDPRQIKTRTQLLNYFVATHGYRRYLEIGVRRPADNHDHVRAELKHGVDPAAQCTYPMPSDDFFARVMPTSDVGSYDLVFVDGLHLADQVERDVLNALKFLTPGGTVALHDVNPLTREAQSETYEKGQHWNGTVWQAFAKLRATRPDLFMCVVDIDEGCGIVRPGKQTCFPLPEGPVDYEFLAKNRKELLNLVSVEEFLALDREFSARRAS